MFLITWISNVSVYGYKKALENICSKAVDVVVDLSYHKLIYDNSLKKKHCVRLTKPVACREALKN